MCEDQNVNPKSARQLFRCLREGIPDPEHVLFYTDPEALYKRPISSICSFLDDVAEDGATVVRFLQGDYGTGKTHTLDLARELALRKGFVVSAFSLEARGVSFAFIERVVAKLIETLAVEKKRSPDAKETVLQYVVRNWASNDPTEDVAELVPDLAVAHDLRHVLNRFASLLRSRTLKDESSVRELQLINEWFQPGAVGLSAAERRIIGARNSIRRENARSVIENMARFFRAIGYAGWTILVDEQEIIPTLMTPRNRNLCNRSLRVIVDSIGEPSGLLYLFATTPEFFTDPFRGINVYPALKGRVRDVLETAPISSEEMRKVADKLLQIYEVAFPEAQIQSRFTKKLSGEMVNLIEERYGAIGSRARGFVQSFVRIADELRDNPQVPPKEALDRALNDVFGQIEREKEIAFKELQE